MKSLIILLLTLQCTLAYSNVIGEINHKTIDDFKKYISKGKIHNITINSIGGNVLAGSTIMGIMEEHKSYGHKFICTVKGIAKSMAASILQTCNVRQATKLSSFGQHFSTDENGKKSTQTLTMDAMRFSNTLSRINIGEEAFIRDYIIPERVFGTKNALEIGYIDKVVQ